MLGKVMCCRLGCTREAEFTVIYGNAPNDATESCASHIGEVVDDNVGRFEVVRISKEE